MKPDVPPKSDPELKNERAQNLQEGRSLIDQAIANGATPEEIEELHRSLGIEQNTKTPEQKVEDTRAGYVKEYLKNRKEVRKRIAIDRTKAAISNVFKSKSRKEIIKEEDYFTKEYTEAKKQYDQARIDLGNDLYNKEKARLEATGITTAEVTQKLQEYKGKEILEKTIIEERLTLLKAKVEGSPINQAKWKRVLHWYMKLSRTQKLVVSTALFAGAAASGILGAGIATSSLAGMTIMRFGKGLASGIVSSHLVRGINFANKGRDARFKADQDDAYEYLKDQFGKGLITQEQYEKQSGKLEAESKKRARTQMLVKASASILVGASVAGFVSHEMGHVSLGNLPKATGTSLDQQPAIKVDDSTTITKPNLADSTRVKPPELKIPDQIKAPIAPESSAASHSVVEATVGKGHGAIQTIRELQKNLKAEYPDPSKAPASVQHILNTKADKLAIEYGMFKPGTNLDSALTKVGAKFEVDANGNLSYQAPGADHSNILEGNSAIKGDATYDGKMMHTEHHGAHSGEHARSSGHTKTLESNQKAPKGVVDENGNKTYSPGQKAPAGATDQNIKTTTKGTDTNKTLYSEGQSAPKGTVDLSTNDTTGLGYSPGQGAPKGAIDPSNLDDKSGLQSAPAGVVDPHYVSSQMVNRTGGGGETISPRTGNYDQGGESNMYAHQNPGNGTSGTENNAGGPNNNGPENHTQTGDGNGTERGSSHTGNTMNMEQVYKDPREHFENIKEVRQTFGRPNVVVENLSKDHELDGIKYNDLNSSYKTVFADNKVQFESYNDYNKERLMQELVGHSKQEVHLVNGENKLEIGTQYFRRAPEADIVSKIPAKYFTTEFNQATFVDGKNLTPDDLDNLVKNNIVNDEVVNPAAGIHKYTFVHQAELDKISKVYREVTPSEQLLGNDKPIGDENLESYINRLSKKVYQTNDGTLYANKNQVNWDNQVGRSLNRGGAVQGTSNYPRGGSSTVNGDDPISPTRGIFNTGNHSLAERAGDYFARFWTHRP